jgi:hypothetical protein
MERDYGKELVGVGQLILHSYMEDTPPAVEVGVGEAESLAL